MVDPIINENFPSSGFQCGIAVLPRISFSHIWKCLTEEVELRKKLATEKPIAKGYNFYVDFHTLCEKSTYCYRAAFPIHWSLSVLTRVFTSPAFAGVRRVRSFNDFNVR